MLEPNQNEDGFIKDHLKEIGNPPDQAKVNKALTVLEAVKRILLRQIGARAVDVGFRILQRRNQFTKDLAIRLHVENKLTEDEKDEAHKLIDDLPFKTLAGVPIESFPDPHNPGKEVFKLLHADDRDKDDRTREENGFVLDVVEARYLPSSGSVEVTQPTLNAPGLDPEQVADLVRTQVHPLIGGVSVGNDLGQAGTLGAVVWDRADGTPCLLSNWHVLAGSRTATVENRCFQPALVDGGNPKEDCIGRFKRGLFNRHGDAALASIEHGRAYSPGEILGLWAPIAGTVEPRLGMPVRKLGRTTGFTRGFIDGVGFTVNLEYEGIGTHHFENQVHIAARIKGEEVSAPGDSGAVWVTKCTPRDRQDLRPRVTELELCLQGEPRHVASRVHFAVALNFAGDVPGGQSGEFAIASSIPDLARRLKFAFRPVLFPPSGLVVKPTPPRPTPPSTSGPGPTGTPVEPATGQGDSAAGPQPPGRRIPPPS